MALSAMMLVICLILVLLTARAGSRVYPLRFSFLFSPAAIFSALNLFIYFVAPIAIETVLGWRVENLLFLQAIVLFNQVFILICMLTMQKVEVELAEARPSYYDVFIPLLIVVSLICAVLLMNLIQNSDLSYNELYKESRRGGNTWKIMLGYVTPYIPFIYRYVTRKTNYKFFILLAAAFLGVTLTGARIAYAELGMLYVLVLLSEGKLRGRYLFALVLLGFFLIVGLTILKMKESEGGIAQLLALAEFLVLSFDMTAHLDRVVAYVSTHGPLFGKTLIDVPYYFMPAALFPDKPMSGEAVRTIYDYAAETGVGYNFGEYIIDYINFGVFGTLFLPALLFLFLSWCYAKYLRTARWDQPPYAWEFIFAYFSVKVLVALRLGVFTHFLGIVILQVGFIVAIDIYLSMYIRTFRTTLHRPALNT